MERGRRLVPAIAPERAIKVFAANRPAGDPVYRVERDEHVTNLVQAAAIRSTGVSSSPAVAELVRDLLAEAGAPVGDDRRDAVRAIEPAPRLLGHPRPEELVALDPRYGQVICACEQVTAAEIAAGVRDARRAAHARRGAQAHARHRWALPGRVLHGRCLVPLLGVRRPAAGGGVAVTVVIVGAGATGLACAAVLGRSAVVVDRIPVCGGILGFDHADTRRLEAAARAAGATLAPGRDGDHLGRRRARGDGTGRRPPHPAAAW